MQETQEMWVRPLGWEDPLEEGMATHSSILAWRIPWTEEPGGLVHGIEKSRTQLKDWARTHWRLWLSYRGLGRTSGTSSDKVPVTLKICTKNNLRDRLKRNSKLHRLAKVRCWKTGVRLAEFWRKVRKVTRRWGTFEGRDFSLISWITFNG